MEENLGTFITNATGHPFLVVATNPNLSGVPSVESSFLHLLSFADLAKDMQDKLHEICSHQKIPREDLVDSIDSLLKHEKVIENFFVEKKVVSSTMSAIGTVGYLFENAGTLYLIPQSKLSPAREVVFEQFFQRAPVLHKKKIRMVWND